MRIVGGEFRGRPLAAPRSEFYPPDHRPHPRGAVQCAGAPLCRKARRRPRVLDLFAGTGALGLEALSRGAAYGVFIEESAEGRGLIRSNVEAFGLTGRTKIFRRDATSLGEAGTMQAFDLVFADPPYGKGLGELALHSAPGQAAGWPPERSVWSRKLRPQASILVWVLRSPTSAAMATPLSVSSKAPESGLVWRAK